MKKVIFLAIAAAAALTACSKSEVIDSKYGNDMIGFETYLGRDAQTKASVTNTGNLTQVFVYGYYTGGDPWSAETKANLWSPMTLACNNGTCTVAEADVRYWTNASDKYTFLAYAPAAIENVLTVSAEEGKNPTLTYNVPTVLTEQKDILYAVPQIDRTKGDDGTVALQMKHALARLTVKAKVTAAAPFEYHVKDVTLTGNFTKSASLVLANQTENACTWTSPAEENLNYNFYNTTALAKDDQANALPVEGIDYAGSEKYLMMIPKDFTSATDTKLLVKYTTYYRAGDLESAVYEKEFPVTTNFEAGKAYAISLEFVQATDNDIKFSVKVTDWVDVTPEQTITPAN